MNKSITKFLQASKQNIREGLFFWVIFVSVCTVISFFLDRLVLDMISRADLGQLPGDVSRSLQSLKEFGQSVAIAVGFLLIFALDKPRRRMLPRLLVCILLPLAVVYPLKIVVHRLRPHRAEEYSTTLGLGFYWGSEPSKGSLSAPLAGEDKIAVDGKLNSTDRQSFPSAHTATAFSFAVGLSSLYPAGSLIFYGLAAGCGFHRILFGAHWFSDVVAGLLIGVLISRAAWRWRNK